MNEQQRAAALRLADRLEATETLSQSERYAAVALLRALAAEPSASTKSDFILEYVMARARTRSDPLDAKSAAQEAAKAWDVAMEVKQ